MKSAQLLLMKVGHALGCHQRPDRSFFVRGQQFPLCARCTGVLLGYLLFLAVRPLRPLLPLYVLLLLCWLMFLDWLIQQIGLKESTNIRRLIVGALGGYGLAGIYAKALKFIWEAINISLQK